MTGATSVRAQQEFVGQRREISWSPNIPGTIVNGTLSGLCIWGATACFAMTGGGWVIVGVILAINGVVTATVALMSLFHFA